MRYANLIRLTAFSYQNEDSNRISEAFLGFFPFNLEDNGVILKKSFAAGFNESKIVLLETTLSKSSLISHFLKNLIDNLDKSQKGLIISQSESRLDNNLDFFLRFDKESWIVDKKLVLTESGKCFHLKISVAAFPKKKGIALNLINNLFSKV